MSNFLRINEEILPKESRTLPTIETGSVAPAINPISASEEWDMLTNHLKNLITSDHPRLTQMTAVLCATDDIGRSHIAKVVSTPDDFTLTTVVLDAAEIDPIGATEHLEDVFADMATAFNTQTANCTSMYVDRCDLVYEEFKQRQQKG